MKKRLYFPLLFLIGLLFVFLMYLFAERWLRALLLYLSTAVWAQQLVSKTSLAWRVASRFIAGETIADAINTARQLNEKGMSVTINYLGEHVQNKQEAVQAKDEIQQLLSGIHESGVRANVSVKPSQLGLNIKTSSIY
jgi:proline dehydrogenase